ncbi:MAG: hypothetical protein KDA91_24905 [Planctomycetaceae bacterium]|nr:hypothetical protein [Planctomycetaceae bacterium]
MNQRTVTEIERLLAQAIEDALAEAEISIPVSPTPKLLHAMAKAATAVYEAVADDR